MKSRLEISWCGLDTPSLSFGLLDHRLEYIILHVSCLRGKFYAKLDHMETLSSSIDSSSPEFKQNSEHHKQLANELKERLARVREGGGEKYRKRQEEQGKLFVRERIERLLDPGSPFLELSALAAY